MRTSSRRLLLFTAAWLALATATAAQAPLGAIAFTVSTPDAASHLYHVVMHCPAVQGETMEFRMPAWTPGYYGLFDFAGHVKNLSVTDGEGRVLTVEKPAPNVWTVRKGAAAFVTLSYDVLANSQFVANAYLDETRGYITPGALFLYIPGQIGKPVTVTIDLRQEWSTVATGLDPASADRPHTYFAADFDVLYDSPILMGNLESLPPFTIQGVRHDFVGYSLGEFDRAQFMEDLAAVVEAGTKIIGDIPYTHYTFMAIGPGRGGIEHLNSTSFGFAGQPGKDRAARIRELSFLAHEYFHHYNVKRIRPIALGPFDYDKANLTNMLWVSEGFTVYYEYLMLARSGRMTEEELLEALHKDIAAHENNTGRLFQSATQSSYDTWNQGPFGGGKGPGVRRTISYYEKGPILAMLLDFKIRHETKNENSLDTVMRALYVKYYKGLGRGWTDNEFRQACESVAGVPLDENFDYATTTREIDYAKYLGYAGLEMEASRPLPAAYLGAIADDTDGKLTVAAVEGGTPAAKAGLRALDVIASVGGARVDARGLEAAVSAKRPGDLLALTVFRDTRVLQLAAVLTHTQDRSFRIQRVAKPSPLEASILASWTARTVNR